MTEPDVEGPVPDGSVPEGPAPEGPAPEVAADAGAAPVPEVYPTLQEEFAELTPDLKRSMFGKPAQMITGLLIGALLLVALLIGLTALAKDGAIPLVSPEPPASPSAIVIGGSPA